jgi:phosphate transport system substrate-binding protein
VTKPWRLQRIAFFALIVVAGMLLLAACGGGDDDDSTATTSSGGGNDVETAGSITGAGASFPAPIYNQMFQQLAADGGPEVNYQSIGSGGGVEQYTTGSVDFGASDAPMSDEEIAGVDVPTLHIATVGGAVVPAYNVNGVDSLNLSGPILADIFLGNITKWDDPAIVEINPDADLPSEEINVVHRSDGSGTTNIFVNYLAAVSQEWKDSVGVGKEVSWPVGSGGQGNEGVTAQVQQTNNSIGYIELAYAEENDIPHAALGATSAGPFVKASLDTASNGIGSATIPADLRVTISATAPSGVDVYPIVGLTWLLVRQEMDDLSVCKAVAEAAWYATHDGQKFAPDLQYVPIAGSVVEIDEEFIKSMTAEGQSCYSQ